MFLNECVTQFTTSFGERGATAGPHGMQLDFEGTLESQMNYFSKMTLPPKGDKLSPRAASSPANQDVPLGLQIVQPASASIVAQKVMLDGVSVPHEHATLAPGATPGATPMPIN